MVVCVCVVAESLAGGWFLRSYPADRCTSTYVGSTASVLELGRLFYRPQRGANQPSVGLFYPPPPLRRSCPRSPPTHKHRLDNKQQLCKSFMSIQRLHKSKHQVEADARREVRQEMRAEQEQMQATLDIQNKAAGRRYNNRSVATSKDMGRRTPSSGSFFSRASTGGGSGAGAANGENAGKAGK